MIRVATIGDRATGKTSVLRALFGVSPPDGIRAIDTSPLAFPAADVYILVCDKDLTAADYRLAKRARAELILALNKADTYTPADLRVLVRRLGARLPGAVVVVCAADPVTIVHLAQADGTTHEVYRHTPPQVSELEAALSQALERAANKPGVIARDLLQRGAGALEAFRRSSRDR